MTKLTATDGEIYRLVAAHDRAADEAPVEFADERDAFRFLTELAEDEFNRAAIRQFAAEDIPILDVQAASDLRVLAYLAANIIAGRFHVVRTGEWHRPARFGGKPPEPGEPEEAEEQEPPPPSVEKTWIKFEIIDDATDKPVSGVTLKVILPDGKPSSKKSDPDGIVEFKDIDPGTCEIERMLDGDALEVVSVQ